MTTRVILFHQHDPGVHHVGGIGTFLDTFIKHAPSDFDVQMVGVSADAQARPVGQWQTVQVGGRPCPFLPVVAAHPSFRGTIPVSVRFTAGLMKYRRLIDLDGAVLDVHRIEPLAAFAGCRNPKVLVLHAHTQDLYNPMTEVIWKQVPWLYFQIERALIRDMDQIYIVREDAVAWYRQRYPTLADRIEFLPTWVDEETFSSLPEDRRRQTRAALAQAHGFDPAARLLLFIGRFEGQKDPIMLLESFTRLNGHAGASHLVMIGEGSLEPQIRGYIERNQLGGRVRLLAGRSQTEIAQWMNAADCLCLSSAFEGMPRVVVEALGCGLPVVTTAVGEAPRLLQSSRAGRLVEFRTPEAMAAGIGSLLRQTPDRQACLTAIQPFTATKILEGVYRRYAELGAGAR
jgi:glycosyltransferase involved in cell wall biosynthesis